MFAAESERISCVNDLHGATATISGIVDDLPYEENENYCCLIKVETIEGFSFPENGRVLVYASEPIVNGPGDRVEGEMRFLLPNAQQGFGTRASLAANHIYLYAFPVTGSLNQFIADQQSVISFRQLSNGIERSVLRRITDRR